MEELTYAVGSYGYTMTVAYDTPDNVEIKFVHSTS